MKRALKIAGTVLTVLVVIVLALAIYVHLSWDRTIDRPVPALSAPRDSASIARGEHLFKDTWQCWTCHASPATDGNAPPSGGMVFDLRATGPGFGLFYSKNLTPDSATGLGAWTDGEIVQAIREGVTRERRMLFPIMPVDWLKGLSDRDALALVAYLRSIPPVTDPVHANEPSFVAKALVAFGVIRPVPAITAPIAAPLPEPTPQYGQYFAMHGAGCADCHCPRNLSNGRFYDDSLFSGSSVAFGNPRLTPLTSYARNITPDNTDGIGLWNEGQFTNAVTMGLRPDSTVLDPHMPYSGYKALSDDELRAVYLFLKSLPPIPRAVPPTAFSPQLQNARGVERGKLIYQARCLTCHGTEGTGARPTSVKLTEVAGSMTDQELMDFIAAGQLNLKMPAFGKTLKPDELVDLVAYVRTWK
ncbi:MAG TPA: c-type cytochrome [Bacteroidota bacterium]